MGGGMFWGMAANGALILAALALVRRRASEVRVRPLGTSVVEVAMSGKPAARRCRRFIFRPAPAAAADAGAMAVVRR